MNKKSLHNRSKFLSYILRHAPDSIGITLDHAGWTNVEQLLIAGKFTREELDLIVSTDNKKRYEYDETGYFIRASQGHSVSVDLGYESTIPPVLLYHGTSLTAITAIKQQGLLKMNRHHVHLSAEEEAALVVAKRRQSYIVLQVNSLHMYDDGYEFYLSTNGVWLTDHVPAKYLTI